MYVVYIITSTYKKFISCIFSLSDECIKILWYDLFTYFIENHMF